MCGEDVMELVKRNTSLFSVRLSHNRIAGNGAIKLAQGISSNSSLKESSILLDILKLQA